MAVGVLGMPIARHGCEIAAGENDLARGGGRLLGPMVSFETSEGTGLMKIAREMNGSAGVSR